VELKIDSIKSNHCRNNHTYLAALYVFAYLINENERSDKMCIEEALCKTAGVSGELNMTLCFQPYEDRFIKNRFKIFALVE